MKRFLLGLADLFFPPHCHLCAEPIGQAGFDFCSLCLSKLCLAKEPYCARCGSRVPETAPPASDCVECGGRRLPWLKVIRFGHYEGELRRAVLACKGSMGEGLARALGRHWAKTDPAWADLGRQGSLIPIPRHWSKSLWMGHNPAASLAHGIGEVLGWKIDHRALARTRATAKQSDLPKSLRKQNVRGAFQFWESRTTSSREQPIVVVDDIMTTGATAFYAAKALKSAGFARVSVAILARGKSRMTG